MNELINHEADCRTASATLGLLNIDNTYGQVFAWLPENLHNKHISNDEIWKKGWL